MFINEKKKKQFSVQIFKTKKKIIKNRNTKYIFAALPTLKNKQTYGRDRSWLGDLVSIMFFYRNSCDH